MGGGEVIREGWLVKSPPMEGRGIKTWRKRYFKLRSSKVLEYYKGEDGEILKGVINLEDCKAVHSDLAHKKYDFVFDIETKFRTYYLVAQTLQEMKAWVDQLCHVCGLSVQDLLAATLPTEDASSPANPVYGTRSSPSLGPSISSPLQPTAPNVRSTAATMGSEGRQLQPLEHSPAFNSTMPRLMQGAMSEVQPELECQQDPPVPLLIKTPATKCIGRQVTPISSTSGGDAASGNSIHSTFPSQHEVSSTDGENQDTQKSYTPSPVCSPQLKPMPKPRLASNTPVSARLSGEVAPAPYHQSMSLPMHIDASNVGRVEMLENGYMCPRQILGRVPNYDYLPSGSPRVPNYDYLPSGSPRVPNYDYLPSGSPRVPNYDYLPSGSPRVPNYDYLPSGSPRPAVPQSSASLKQRNSALLRDQISPTEDTNPTYINVQQIGAPFPPVVNRSIKPEKPLAPRVNRKLKPKSNTLPSSSDLLIATAPSTGPAPVASLITSGVDSRKNNNHLSGTCDMSPECPQRHSKNVESSNSPGKEDIDISFNENDCPKPSSRTMLFTYTQVEFDKTAGKMIVVDSDKMLAEAESTSPKTPEAAKKSPVAAPRLGMSSVSYMDVDIKATRALANATKERLKKNHMSLREAEHKALQEKPYINVNRQGSIDDDSDPDYYTYMRDFTYQEALKAYTTEDIVSIDVGEKEVYTEKQDLSPTAIVGE